LPFAQELVGRITSILVTVCKNPNNPKFNHYMFESLASLIRYLCAGDVGLVPHFENSLFPTFQQVIALEVSEFIPYIYEIVSLLLEQTTPSPASLPHYQSFLVPLLTPSVWNYPQNIPSQIRFLQALIQNIKNLDVKQLELVLGVYEKLVVKPSLDHEAFYLLESIFEFIPLPTLEPYITKIFVLIFTRLTEKKTFKFIKSFLVFLSLFIGKHGPAYVEGTINKIQPQTNLFLMIIDSLLIPNILKVNGTIERKMCAIALTKFLTEYPSSLNSPYVEKWGTLMDILIQLLEAPEQATEPDPEYAEHYGENFDLTPSSHSKLVYAKKSSNDPFLSIEPKSYLANAVKKAHSLYAAKFPPPGAQPSDISRNYLTSIINS
jgi:exportin-2 (importin alpha re-exporter)